MTTLNFGATQGLTPEEGRQLQELAQVYEYHRSRNALKDKYYEGHVTLIWRWGAAGARRRWMPWPAAACLTALWAAASRPRLWSGW